MAISYIGSATGAVTASLPAFTEAGDVLLLFAFRDGSTTAPTLAAGWTSLGTQTGTTCSGRLAYKLATGSSEAVGTWTNATSVVVQVYRGADPADPIGNVVPLAGTSSNTVQFPGITLSDTSGTSWCAAFVGHRSTAPDLTVAPTGFTHRVLVSDATDEAAGHDTNGGVTGFAGQTVTVGGGSAQGWITYVAEVLAAAEAGGITGTASGGSDTAGSAEAAVRAAGSSAGSADTSGSSAGSIGSGGGGGEAFVRQFKVVESSSNVGLQVLTATLDQPTLAGSTLYAVVRSSIDSNSYAESQIVVGAPALQNDPSPPESFLTKLESLRNEAGAVNCHQISSYRPNVAAGITAVSDYWCNTAGGNRIFSNYRWLIVFEIANVTAAPLIDSFGQIATVAAGTDTLSAGTFTMPAAGILVGVSNNESQTSGAPYVPAPGTGSTDLVTFATFTGAFGPYGRAAYRDVAGAGSAAQTWSTPVGDEYFTHAIALRGSGSAPEGRAGTASGSAEASGSAAAAARIAGTGLDSASTTGSAAADVRAAATATGGADSTGSAAGVTRIAAQASDVTSTAGIASGSVGQMPATASASGSADSTGSATTTAGIAGTGSGQADTVGSSAGTVPIAAGGTGNAVTVGSATATADIAGSGNGQAGSTGSSAGAVPITAVGAGSADTDGSAIGTVPPPAGAITASGVAGTGGNGLGTVRVDAAGSGTAETPGNSSGSTRVGAAVAGSATVTGAAAAAARAAAAASGSADTAGTAQAAGPGAAGDAIAAGSAAVTGAAIGGVHAAAEAGGSAEVAGAASARVAARAASGGAVDADGTASGVVGIRAQGNGASDTGGLARGGQGFIPDPDRVIAVPGRSRVFIADARPLLRAVARPRIHVVLRG